MSIICSSYSALLLEFKTVHTSTLQVGMGAYLAFSINIDLAESRLTDDGSLAVALQDMRVKEK